MADGTALDVFAGQRRRLVGLAYRMLGSLADAEDVVQEVWLRWQRSDTDAIERPEAWLTTVTTRAALDRSRDQARRREDYPGPWLPEPLVQEDGPEQAAEMADSLTLGFLVLLDTLGPVERAVFILADVFGTPYKEISATVGKPEAACRQIASRARAKLRHAPPPSASAGHRQTVDALLLALSTGDADAMLRVLAPDVVLVSDGGPTRRAARRPVLGADRVARLLLNLSRRLPGATAMRNVVVNGDTGLVLTLDDAIDDVFSFEVEDGRITCIRVVRNPDKLARVGLPVALD
ncbi:MAG TPA: RNA polymerase sigma factor SigJ [Acidimicrobiales bacterium]|nr:RNA polymerase sigma factor SigJ [Acidimicrobiales bacterium]